MATTHDGRCPVISIDSGSFRADLLRRRDALVVQHLDLAGTVARHVARGLPRTFDLEDLTSEGYVGLLRAATRFQPEIHDQVPFRKWAWPIVYGAIIDSVRRGAYIEHTRESIEGLEGPNFVASYTPDPAADIDQARLTAAVGVEVRKLKPRARALMAAYYGPQEATLRNIGGRMGVTESRASQIHSEALKKLRRRLAA